MGHGIFPNYGLQYQKTIFPFLTKAEKKAVFFPERKRKQTGGQSFSEEDEPQGKKGRKTK